MTQFLEFGSGFNDYFNSERRGRDEGAGSSGDCNANDYYLIENDEFLTDAPEDAPAFIEQFKIMTIVSIKRLLDYDIRPTGKRQLSNNIG